MLISEFTFKRVFCLRSMFATLSAVMVASLAPDPAYADELHIHFYGTENAVKSFRIGVNHLRSGEKIEAVIAFEQAAENGNAIAQWKLGHMYAKGDGVAVDHNKAFAYYSRIANAYADEFPGSRYSRVVAEAFVALGHYYQGGIEDNPIKPDVRRARRLYFHAASHFGDPEAQYRLGVMFIEGSGGLKDGRQAARWLKLAADKGHVHAQHRLGRMLMQGEVITKQPFNGLTWLTIANALSRGKNKAIRTDYDKAVGTVAASIRLAARQRADAWLGTRPYLIGSYASMR